MLPDTLHCVALLEVTNWWILSRFDLATTVRSSGFRSRAEKNCIETYFRKLLDTLHCVALLEVTNSWILPPSNLPTTVRSSGFSEQSGEKLYRDLLLCTSRYASLRCATRSDECLQPD